MTRPIRGDVFAAVVSLLVAIGGCQLQRDPLGLTLDRDVPGVHSVVVAGDEVVRVLVVRFSRDTPIQSGGTLPVGDADVRIMRDGVTTTLSAGDVVACVGERSHHLVQPGEGCYTAILPSAVAPGDTFELTVRLSDGSVVHGEVVIPAAPVVRSPSPGDTVPITASSQTPGGSGSLTVDIGAPPDAALLEIGVANARAPSCHVRVQLERNDRFISGPTARITPDDAGMLELGLDARCVSDEGAFEPVGELPARLLALAYDTAYARWVDEVAVDGQDLRFDGASAGLTGAVGYFAGASRVVVPIEIVER